MYFAVKMLFNSEEVKSNLQDLEAEEKKQDIYVFTVKGKENITAYCRQLLKEADQYVISSTIASPSFVIDSKTS